MRCIIYFNGWLPNRQRFNWEMCLILRCVSAFYFEFVTAPYVAPCVLRRMIHPAVRDVGAFFLFSSSIVLRCVMSGADHTFSHDARRRAFDGYVMLTFYFESSCRSAGVVSPTAGSQKKNIFCVIFSEAPRSTPGVL